MSNESSRKIDLGTHALRVRELGGGGPTFVCLHGFLDDTKVWDGLLPTLSGIGRVILVQQRGTGDSTAPEGACSIDDLASDLGKLLDALGVARAILVGHALGGLVAVKLALRNPARAAGLVLISSFTEVDQRAAAQWGHVVRAGEVNKLQGLARSVYGPTSRREVDGDGGALTEIARAHQALAAEPVTAQLGAITCPTVVLAGEGDAAGSGAARAIAAAIPGARLELVAQRGDALHVEAPDAVVQAIRSLVA